MSDRPSDVWSRCLQSIRRKIQPQSFQTWFHPISSVQLGPDKAVIVAPTPWFADFLEQNYSWLIRATVEEETTWKPRVEFVVEAESKGALDQTAPTGPSTPERPSSSADPSGLREPSRAVFPLSSKYRFEQFVVGNSNEFSFTASQSVAESPGQTLFNPLVIYSGVGLGKTHLLQAIGDHCIRYGTAQRVVYVTAEKFVSDYIGAIKKKDTTGFLRTYRTADVLLVDDIQFFVEPGGSQREFFHTFNALYQNGKQIVISSDRPPYSLKNFEDRLISRFEGGLVASIEPPDLETRMAILQQKAEDRSVSLPTDVAFYIAENIDSNVRELEGTLNRLLAFSILKGLPLTVTLARQSLIQRPRQAGPALTIEQIQKITSEFFQIGMESLVGPSRKQDISQARQVSMYLCKSLIGAPLKTIGRRFGNRDHSTVIHACRQVQGKLANDSRFEGLVSQLRGRLKGLVSA